MATARITSPIILACPLGSQPRSALPVPRPACPGRVVRLAPQWPLPPAETSASFRRQLAFLGPVASPIEPRLGLIPDRRFERLETLEKVRKPASAAQGACTRR
jgi:hypothetical protein